MVSMGYFHPLGNRGIVPIMEQDDLLSTLRQLEPEPALSTEEQLLHQMIVSNNHLEDLKLKQSITNELLLELLEQVKGMGCSDHASQARPIRNNTTLRPIRKWSGKRIY
jgi:hypothetical protein